MAVPNHQVVTAKVDPAIPRCEQCGEPRSAHPGSQYSEWLFNVKAIGPNWTGESEFEVLKSCTWGSCTSGWKTWISRDLYLSVRLLHLFNKFKAKGFYQATGRGRTTPPNKQESAWINETLRVVVANGIPLHADGTLSDADAKWFRDYIKTHTRSEESAFDIKAAEKRLKCKLPKSYVDFITKVGPLSFANVDEQDGFTAVVLAPDALGDDDYRAGAIQDADEESNAVNGVMFATTGHGDCFCFDVQKGKREYPVYLFKHEYNSCEPYADNFAACIKRFAGCSADLA